eukprot:286375-Amphidinium_carterae.1
MEDMTALLWCKSMVLLGGGEKDAAPLKDFVLKEHGELKWQAILGELGLSSDEEVLEQRQYDDSITLNAVSAALKVLGMEVGDFLRVFGAHFVRTVYDKGSQTAKLLKQMGDTLPEFITHLNHLHQVLERKSTFRACDFPVFKVDCIEDKAALADVQECMVSYFSHRGTLLVPLAEGVFTELGDRVYSCK